MTNRDLNPFNWSPDLKNLAAVLAIISTIIGSVWKSADYIGGRVYSFAQQQTLVVDHLKRSETSIGVLLDGQKKLKDDLDQERRDAAKAAAEAATAAKEASRSAEETAKDLAAGRARTLPRIDKLEDAISKIVPAIARIEQYTQDTVAITHSHDADIKATRNAVAPKGGGP